MATLALTLLVAALVAYALATGLFFGHLISNKPNLSVLGMRGLIVGMVAHGAGKLLRVAELGTVPAINALEAVNLLALVIAVVFVYVAKRYGVPVLGAFAAPMTAVTLAASLAFGKQEGAVPEALASWWFPVHLGFALTADALFIVAGAASIAFIVQDHLLKKKKISGGLFKKLPSLYLLDEIVHRLIVIGWLLMTIGMAAGMFYAKQEWGAYWSWDPRQSWSLLIWLLFSAIMHARLLSGWRGRKAAYLTVFAVVMVLVALFGLDVLTNTKHGGDYK
jgi:cytochrome c-type biogenesis protein CcsB